MCKIPILFQSIIFLLNGNCTYEVSSISHSYMNGNCRYETVLQSIARLRKWSFLCQFIELLTEILHCSWFIQSLPVSWPPDSVWYFDLSTSSWFVSDPWPLRLNVWYDVIVMVVLFVVLIYVIYYRECYVIYFIFCRIGLRSRCQSISLKSACYGSWGIISLHWQVDVFMLEQVWVFCFPESILSGIIPYTFFIILFSTPYANLEKFYHALI